jgi:hypothetical protein
VERLIAEREELATHLHHVTLDRDQEMALRDMAEKAARWLYDHCDDPHSKFDAQQRWPWLEHYK